MSLLYTKYVCKSCRTHSLQLFSAIICQPIRLTNDPAYPESIYVQKNSGKDWLDPSKVILNQNLWQRDKQTGTEIFSIYVEPRIFAQLRSTMYHFGWLYKFGLITLRTDKEPIVCVLNKLKCASCCSWVYVVDMHGNKVRVQNPVTGNSYHRIRGIPSDAALKHAPRYSSTAP